MKDTGVNFNFTAVGVHNALYNIWWPFPEWVEEYRNSGIVSGVTIDGKAISND